MSVSPKQVDAALIERIAPDAGSAIDRCVQRGLLVTHGAALAFRHELAREAVLQSLHALRRATLHASVFAALREQGDDEAALARQVHHAEGAGLVDEVVRLAPRAARHAAASGAHREAARLYALALRHGHALGAAERADVLDARAVECALIGRHGEAIRARSEALELHRRLGDKRREGIDLRWLARLRGWTDSLDAALEDARGAIAVLDKLPSDAELANACSTLCNLNLVGERFGDVEPWGSKAIAIAEQVGDAAALSQALSVVGTARLRFVDDAAGWRMLERALELALAQHLEPEAAFAFQSLNILSLVHRRYADAVAHADRGIGYCEAKGIDVFAERLRIRRAFALLQSARWDAADADLARVREYRTASPMEQALCAFVQTLLDLRRGAVGAAQRVEPVCAAMERLGVRVWFTSIAGLRAEAAWLAGDADAVQAAATPALERAIVIGDPWRAGELAGWLHRAARRWHCAIAAIDRPHGLELEGQPRAAAALWQQLGCPYHAALALCSGDEPLQREALERFEQLGAAPAAQALRRVLRLHGARGIARGPQPRTRTDPLGLTVREREVFELLLRGQSNAAMAQRLHRSPRTVESHVAAVFAKLGVKTRAALIAGFAAPRAGGKTGSREPESR